jgi:hypothetical protein
MEQSGSKYKFWKELFENVGGGPGSGDPGLINLSSPDRRNPSTFPVTVIEPRTQAAAAMNASSEFPAADDRHGNTSL